MKFCKKILSIRQPKFPLRPQPSRNDPTPALTCVVVSDAVQLAEAPDDGGGVRGGRGPAGDAVVRRPAEGGVGRLEAVQPGGVPRPAHLQEAAARVREGDGAGGRRPGGHRGSEHRAGLAGREVLRVVRLFVL